MILRCINSRRNFFNKLEELHTHFEVRLGTLVRTKDGYRQKGVDTLIAIDMITKAFMNHYDIAILVAGDRDFVNVVRAVKEFTGKLVYGAYEPSSVADELVRTFDNRIPLREESLRAILFKL